MSARRRTARRADYEPVELDREQTFIYDKTFDLSKLEPTVALHPDPGQRKLAKDLATSSSTAPTSARAPAARPAISSPSPKSCAANR